MIKVMSDDSDFLKVRENNLLLSDKDISILSSNNINYLNYKTLEELLFVINEKLIYEYNSNLDELSIKLSEMNYYNYSNK